MKLVVAEDGSGLAAQLWGTRHRAASSLLSYPEGRAALAAARRARRLTANAHARALEVFEAAHRRLSVVGIDATLAHQAGDLAEDLGLRGYDGVHLASALTLGPDTTMVTWDRDLAGAALEVGLAVAPAP